MRDSEISKLQKEFSQVAAAVRVMGTRRPKLLAMARLVRPVLADLTGKRPELVAVRREMHRQVQRLQRVSARPREASRALEAMVSALGAVREVGRKGYGTDSPQSFPPITVVDRWGLTRRELVSLLDSIRGAYGVLQAFDLGVLLDKATFVIDPTMLTGEAVWYVPGAGHEYVASPFLDRQHDVLVAVADRALDAVMSQTERREWFQGGQRRGRQAFARVLVDFLEGKTLPDQTYDRLEKTLLSKV